MTSVGDTEIASLTSPHDSKLSVSTQFTMPSVDEIANSSSDGLDPGFLKVCKTRTLSALLVPLP